MMQLFESDRNSLFSCGWRGKSDYFGPFSSATPGNWQTTSISIKINSVCFSKTQGLPVWQTIIEKWNMKVCWVPSVSGADIAKRIVATERVDNTVFVKVSLEYA